MESLRLKRLTESIDDKSITKDQDSEKKSPEDESLRSFSQQGVSSDSEITWHYLTFETVLPSPAYLAQAPRALHEQAPAQCPDLTPFVSPFLWSEGRKLLITWLSCLATALTAYNAGAYFPGINQMREKWALSELVATLGITIFTCGFAIAPMVLAPFSEINGRRPIFLATGTLYVIFQVLCAVTPTFAGMFVGRFLAGCTSSTFSTMVGGVVSDIYHAKSRNTAMALFTGAALFGTGLGPLCSGFIAQHTSYRWIFYVQIISCGLLMVLIVIFFKETRGSVLLSRKARALNRWYEELETQSYYGVVMFGSEAAEPQVTVPQRIRWKVQSDEDRTSIVKMISVSLYRPFHLLFTEPIVFFFSAWISFGWAVLYALFSIVPMVFRTRHNFNLEQSESVSAAICIAAIISTIISIYQERLARRLLSPKRQIFLDTPEGRLYFSCVQSAFLPIGLFWFAFTSYESDPWIVPALAIGCATMGIFSIYLAVFNYLADAYHRYASSALAAQSFCRNMLGGCFPLFTPYMFNRMTYPGAASFLGGFAALLTVVPWILVFYGPRIRAKSKFASEIMKDS